MIPTLVRRLGAHLDLHPSALAFLSATTTNLPALLRLGTLHVAQFAHPVAHLRASAHAPSLRFATLLPQTPMQLPKLTPLQSRLLASALATILVVVLWIAFQPHHFVYAADLPTASADALHAQFGQAIPATAPDDRILSTEEKGGDGGYAPEFAYFARNLVGRQAPDLVKLTNNEVEEGDVDPGTTQHFMLEKSQLRLKEMLELRGVENGSEGPEPLTEEDGNDDGSGGELRKRQAGSSIWISANTCRQPALTAKFLTGDVPQLTLYVSTTNKEPGPNSDATTSVPFVGGYANYTTRTSSDLYVGVSAPSLTQGWNGSWHFELTASTDGYYHSYNDTNPFVYLIDTDSHSALFISYNLTDSNDTDTVANWEKSQMPFTMYTYSNDTWNPMMGLERSYCGLKSQFNTTNNITVNSSVTTKFGLGFPKGQFHVQNLTSNKTYNGFLAVSGANGDVQLPDEGTVRGGGQVFQQFTFATKVDDSCQVVFDLDFCSDVAYAVPSAPNFKANDTGLKALYDNQAKAYWQNFSNSLAQVACDTTATAQYSLARTCKDCERDYKSWLCSVLIPRCDDWTATDDWLQDRNINTLLPDGTLPYSSNMSLEFNNTVRKRFAYSQSRNPMVDTEIKPGPYKELLPCEDLCFDIVRSCPAQLGFSCPNSPAREVTYSKRDPNVLKCNFPGAVVKLNVDRGGAGLVKVRMGMAVLMAGLAVTWSWI